MRKRRRVAVTENAIRGIIGQPQLVRVGNTYEKTGTVTAGTGVSGPAIIRLGPVVVRSSATLELTVGRAGITVPPPERQAAAFGTLATGVGLGVMIAQLTTEGLGYEIIGGIAGCYGGARLWNRWVRDV